MSAKFKQPDQKHDFSEPPKERIRKQFAPQLAGIHTKLGEIRVQNPTPGPGAYNAPENVNKGQWRSFLGGKIQDLNKQDPGFVLPGP